MSASDVGAVRAPQASTAPHVWLALAGTLLLGEFALLAACFDARPRVADFHGWSQILGHVGVVMPFATAVITATVLLGGSRLRFELPASAALVPDRRRWPWLLGHLTPFTVFFWLTTLVFGSPAGRSVSGWWAALWVLAGVTQVAAGTSGHDRCPLLGLRGHRADLGLPRRLPLELPGDAPLSSRAAAVAVRDRGDLSRERAPHHGSHLDRQHRLARDRPWGLPRQLRVAHPLRGRAGNRLDGPSLDVPRPSRGAARDGRSADSGGGICHAVPARRRGGDGVRPRDPRRLRSVLRPPCPCRRCGALGLPAAVLAVALGLVPRGGRGRDRGGGGLAPPRASRGCGTGRDRCGAGRPGA